MEFASSSYHEVVGENSTIETAGSLVSLGCYNAEPWSPLHSAFCTRGRVAASA